MERRVTEFDWAVYADATFAGLSNLIPIPLLDLLFEQFFRRRMPTSIARRREQRLSPDVTRILNRNGCSAAGCLLFFPWLLFQFLKRLSRKILYFLAVKEASDTLSYYWHRAFLINYMIWAGHLDNAAKAETARQAMDQILQSIAISPMSQAAQEVARQSHHILRTLWRVIRRNDQDEVVAQDRDTLKSAWSNHSHYLEEVAERYQATYEAITAQTRVESEALS